jgi:hypothetical protein
MPVRTLTHAALLVTAALLLPAYRPFSPVTSVCPACPEKGDRLTMAGDGKVLVADIVGKNQDGYVVSKFGELRFIQYPEISKVAWVSGAEPKGLDNYDQILLKDQKSQTILHGNLLSVEAGKPLALKSPRGIVFMVMPNQAYCYYQRGVRKPPPAAPAQ